MTSTPSTLPLLLERSARRAPERDALIYLDQHFTYAALLDHVRRAAAGFQAAGVGPGDRVALLLPNCPQFVIAFFGALSAGAIVTTTSPLYTLREAVHQWRDAGAKVAVADARLVALVTTAQAECPALGRVILTEDTEYAPNGFPRLAAALHGAPLDRLPDGPVRWSDLLRCRPGELPQQVPDDIACLQYTGGTTGTSKGAMLTHANFWVNIHQTRERLSGGDAGPEFSVAVLPLFHIFALTCVMLSALESGGTLLILPRFDAALTLAAIRRHRPAFFHGVPTMYVGFLNVPGVGAEDFRSLRCCVTGGAPIAQEVHRRFEELLSDGARLIEGYGLSECSPVSHFNSGPENRPGTIGRPVRDTECRIVDAETGTRELPVGEPGELILRGPQVMRGYWEKADETALVLRGGWLHTGDIAVRDADGFYTIVDRKKDLILAGGFNIYPREIEEVLFTHPHIREALVIGVPDSYRGETVKACIVPHAGAILSPESVIAFCRERLAAYKTPRIVEIRDSLPKSGVGKYLRRELRREAAAVPQPS